jgi:hypothetical protein
MRKIHLTACCKSNSYGHYLNNWISIFFGQYRLLISHIKSMSIIETHFPATIGVPFNKEDLRFVCKDSSLDLEISTPTLVSYQL